MTRAAQDHVQALQRALARSDAVMTRAERWGRHLARTLPRGARLLACGNGGSAAHAQHLTSELVGRYRDERMPLAAVLLCADASALTAIGNDYGFEETFARAVRAHGRPGDVLIAFSTSGASPNVRRAVHAAHERGLLTWAVTGARPNPLAVEADEACCVDASTTATVQEVHQVIVHVVCEALDAALDPDLDAHLDAVLDPATGSAREPTTIAQEVVRA